MHINVQCDIITVLDDNQIEYVTGITYTSQQNTNLTHFFVI